MSTIQTTYPGGPDKCCPKCTMGYTGDSCPSTKCKEVNMREEPEDGYRFGWKDFDWWCNHNGIGIHPDDWVPWWECWKSGYLSGNSR